MHAVLRLLTSRAFIRGWVFSTLLVGGALTFAGSTSQPAQDANPNRALQECFDSLDRLALRGKVRAEEVERIVSRAIQEATAIKSRLTAQTQVSASQPRPGVAGNDPPSPDRQRVREQLCSLELLIGDLHVNAAGLLQGDAAMGRLNQAIQVYRRARVEYRETAIGVMGYIGESKALRAQRKLGEAMAALEPVFEISRKPTTTMQAELGRIATMEKMEILLVEDPERAMRELATWRSSRAIGSNAEWSARVDWLLARAGAERLMRTPTTQPSLSIAEMAITEALNGLRSPAAVRSAPASERLRIILKLETRLGRPLMTAAEVAQWADLLWAAEAGNAIEFYQRAVKMDKSALSVDGGLRFASLLIRGQSYQQAADWCRELAERKDASAAQRTMCLRFASACLVQLFRDTDVPAHRTRIGRQSADILAGLIRSNADAATRRDCLREWTEIVGRLDGAGACVQMLEGQSGLVQDDAWLLYAMAAGLRDGLRGRDLSGQAAKDAARKIVAMLENARRIAQESGPADLQGRIDLMLAAVQSEAPLLDKQAALVVMIEAWDRLIAQPDLVHEAVQSRLGLLVELGLTEDAIKFVEQLPADSIGQAGDALLSLASILAERFDSVSEANRDSERQRIRTLCQRAVSGTLKKSPEYDNACLSAARILLRVKAGRDARALLESASSRRSAGVDESTTIAIRLLIAQAYGQEGNLNEAIAICDKLQTESPQHHPVLMTRARLALDANNPADAVNWYRKAREIGRAGSEEWCEATLGMTEAMLQAQRPADAASLLRVCLALYPDFANPQMLSSAKKLQARAARSDGSGLISPSTHEE